MRFLSIYYQSELLFGNQFANTRMKEQLRPPELDSRIPSTALFLDGWLNLC